MAAGDDPKVLGRTRLSFSSQADVDEFVSTLEGFEKGEIGPDQWRAFRLVRGTYGQRQTVDAQMLRVKIPQGVLTADQLRALADVSEKYSRGFGHITTRQNLQFHFMKLHDVELAMRLLADAGLTTREACGNSVRNITGCAYAGVAADEPFDVTPYADALTRYLLRHPLSASLPRKFKIAFEGCKEDHVYAAINDVGFRARVKDGRRGFRVTVAGGTAILCTDGYLLEEFLPAEDVYEVAEALVRVFHKLGDREHRQRNRLKFLVRQLGWDGFRAEYEKALAGFRAEGGSKLTFAGEPPASEPAVSFTPAQAPSVAEVTARVAASKTTGPGIAPDVTPTPATDYAHWHSTNVQPQKQAGYSIVHVTLPLGDLTGSQMRVVGDLALAYGDGQVRVTPDQDFVFRWVPNAKLPELFQRLAAAGLGLGDANSVADVASCPGAESCKLAVTQSRGLGRLLTDFLRERPDLVKAAYDLRIKISGCPNGCGQHHIAGLGFQGSVRKLGNKVVPQYFVMVGGGVSEKGAHFGRIAAKIPARRLATALERLIALYQKEKAPQQSATEFFRTVDVAKVKATVADLESMKLEEALPEDFIDLAESTEFKPETMEGECAA